jgi:hypothetical protein
MGLILKSSRSRGTTRLVAVAIGDSCKDDGTGAWPAMHTIAARAGASERTAQRSVGELVQLGELVIDKNAGPKRSNLYTIRVGRLLANVVEDEAEAARLAAEKLAGVPKRRGDKSTRVTELHHVRKGGEGCQSVPAEGDKTEPHGDTVTSPDPSYGSVLDPSGDPSYGARLLTAPPEKAAAETESVVPEDLVEAWNTYCVPLGMAAVRELSHTRRARALARIREHPEQTWWNSVFGKIGKSAFLQGRSKPRNGSEKSFRANFDWLIENDTNALKISEGRYDG